MSNQDVIKALIKKISGNANVIAIPRIYLDLLENDHAAAFFLSQSVYWSDKSFAGDGWFWKSAKEWKEEAGLSTYQVTRSAKVCEKWVEVKLKKANAAPTLHYRVNMEALTNSILEFLENRETGKSRNSKIDLRETVKSLTETTPETTKPEEDEEEKNRKIAEEKQQALQALTLSMVKVYEQNMGYAAPIIRDEIFKVAASGKTLEYFQECVRVAVQNGGRSWRYLSVIIENGPNRPQSPTERKPRQTTRAASPQAPAPVAQPEPTPEELEMGRQIAAYQDRVLAEYKAQQAQGIRK